MDVASLVKNITSAYEGAATLVSRIRRQKAADTNAQLQPIDDLLDSLTLGPSVLRGHYDPDAKRFGGLYMSGDTIAREQLKDALINLQMTVLSGLRSVLLDETDPDYDAIQCASDDCRVNVAVCLLQLSQRVSKAARGVSSPGRAHIYDQVPAQPIQRSNSHSTTSSGPARTTPLTPPEPDPEYWADAASANPQRRQTYVPRPPDFDVMNGTHAASSTGFHPTSQDILSPVQPRHPSLSCVRPLDSPVSPPDSAHPSQNRLRDIPYPPLPSSRNNLTNPGWSHSLQETSGHVQGEPSTDVGYFPSITNDHPRANSLAGLTSATLGKNRLSPNLVPVNRKPVTVTQDGSLVQSPTTMDFHHRMSIPEEVEEKIYIPATFPMRTPSQSGTATQQLRSMSIAGNPEYMSRSESISYAPTMMPHRQSVVSSLQRTETGRASISGPLSLPTEKNLRGFCKGAFRLQIGNEKDAFVVASKPVGNYGLLPYWQCKSSKCYYEGSRHENTRPGAKKPEQIYDPVVRDYGGIRYKWAFLAKSHVTLKHLPEGKINGSHGSFCCIFCTAEAALRDWPAAGTITTADRASQRSGNSGDTSGSSSMPIYGNIHSFMDHLQMHRREEYWPGIEMQGRMKCIVGRVAQRGEDFEINLLPITPEMNWHEMSTGRDN